MSETHWNTSAEMYSVESEKISFYKVTNQQLIAAGQIQPGMTVVDLACGSGLTTRTILSKIGEKCTIYAVDFAKEMLRQARQVISSHAVHFIHASADDFSRHIPEPVDCVFCNAAFWHFPDANAVLSEIHTILKTTGRFLFNLPDQQFDFGDGLWSQMALAVADCLQQPQKNETLQYSYRTIEALATGNGFRIVDFKTIGIPLRPEDLIRFYSIPHIGARRFPGVSLTEKYQILTKAFSVLSPDEALYYRWAQFVLVPCDEIPVSSPRCLGK
jgi:ubiquinone/menaquinone biosynthesis C-methylase UbiE